MKKEKIKPYKSVISNVIWSLRGQFKYAPMSAVFLLLEIPTWLAINWIGVYLPSAVIKEVTGGYGVSHAAVHIGMIILVLLICRTISQINNFVSSVSRNSYRLHMEKAVHYKALTSFYETYERHETHSLYSRAIDSLLNWGGYQPIFGVSVHMVGVVRTVLGYIMFASVTAFVNPWLVPLVSAAPLVNRICSKLYNKWEYSLRDKRSSLNVKTNYLLRQTDDFSAGKDIRIYSIAGWFREMYHDLCRAHASFDRAMISRQFLSRLADLLVILLRDSAAYALLIMMFLRGEVTVDAFVLYFAAISSLSALIESIVGEWNGLHRTSLAICDLRQFLDLPDKDGTGEEDISGHIDRAPGITFENVCYRYEGAEEDTIKGISFTIHPGEKIAIVGLNGAGKSTTVNLLCGLYLPTRGRIFINGVSVDKFYRRDLYKLFSPVFQSVKTSFFTIGETVSSHVTEDYDRERAEHCLRAAGFGEKLDSLPRGLDTCLDKQVDENGIDLSGGEKQKLMLARALYKDAPMLVLDEPTSALDPIAESAVYEQYLKMAEGKSAVFISHRLASTRFCDRILFLEDGRIVEQGTHEQLLALGGRYAELYEMQSCWYRDEKEA